MAFEIPEHFARSFTTNVELLLQRAGPSLLPHVSVNAYTGAEAAQVVKQFGSVEFAERTTRHKDTDFSDLEHKQRWIFPTDYTLALPIDKEDELRMLDSPLSPYVEAMRKAWARRVDNTIRDAFFGTAQTGKNGATATSFPGAQQIAASGAGLTISKLREARKMLKQAHVDLEREMPIIPVTARQVDDLLGDTNITSADFNTVKALVNGEVNTYMGFRFVPFEGLEKSGNNRRVPVFVPSAIVLGQWNGLETRIGERADKEYLTQVFMRGTIGATRTQEKKVIEILCDES